MSGAATKTEKGAPALSSTSSPQLDLFFGGLVRGAPGKKLRAQMRESWAASPEETVALVMHARDARKGKGERKVVTRCLVWLRKHKPKTYAKNLRTFLELGYFKDLLTLATAVKKKKLPRLGTRGEALELELFAEVLQKDLAMLDEEAEKAGGAQVGEPTEAGAGADDGKQEEKKEEGEAGEGNEKTVRDLKISLAAKWAPSEGTSFDKKVKLAKRLSRLLFPKDKTPQRAYRKAIGRLRNHLKVVERSMCLNEWKEINFSTVPAKAHKNLKNAFKRHQEKRYAQYLDDLQEGKNGAKINSSGLQPHELVKEYLVQKKAEDATSEAQWRALVDELKEAGTFGSSVAVVDVSGSMAGIPMEVAIAMGLVVAELCSEPFKGRVLSFHENPTWHTVRGSSLKDRVTDISHMSWGMTTNIQKVFDLILSEAKKASVQANSMPKTMYIFSDMQFDAALGGAANAKEYATTHARVQAQFAEAGYELPQIVYWNLRGDTASFPTNAHTPGVAMVSGFSAQLLKLFMSSGELSPLFIMGEAIAPYLATVAVDDAERQADTTGDQGDEDIDSDDEETPVVLFRRHKQKSVF